MNDGMTTLGIQVALRLWDCAPSHTLRICPAAWHLARFLAASLLLTSTQFVWACSSPSDTSSRPSAISSIAMAFRKDWHSHCTSTCRENARDAGGTSEGVQGRLNQPGNNSTQEV